MKVCELVEYLKQYDPEEEVFICIDDKMLYTISSITMLDGNTQYDMDDCFEEPDRLLMEAGEFVEEL